MLKLFGMILLYMLVFNLCSISVASLCTMERKEFLRVSEIKQNILQDKLVLFF